MRSNIRIIWVFILMVLATACENDIEKINLLTGDTAYPDVMGENIEVIFSDSAKVKVQLQAKKLKQFNNVDKPYSEFPEGLTVYFYDDSMEIESEIQADYARYDEEKKLWHASGNVVARNLKTGERLDS